MGENKVKKCLHLCCGTVYLFDNEGTKDYINIDLQLPNSYLAEDRPDLVERNKTTADKYYKELVTPKMFLGKKLQDKEIVCDVFANIRNLPYPPESVDEILIVQGFEHFTYREGIELLQEWYRVLKFDGVLIIDVPDLDGTITLYKKNKEWATRLLYGSQKNDYGIHRAMYTKNTIKKLLRRYKFGFVEFMPNIHTYPAFAIKVKK